MSQYTLLTILSLATMGSILLWAVFERVAVAKAKATKERSAITHRHRPD